MAENAILAKLPEALLPWYDDSHRELPWRQDKDPYHIWVSEIMLQQTRVEAVKGYYARFLEKLPTVADLAQCDDDALHKLWEGLGYYSRVRNLKKAAQKIQNEIKDSNDLKESLISLISLISLSHLPPLDFDFRRADFGLLKSGELGAYFNGM